VAWRLLWLVASWFFCCAIAHSCCFMCCGIALCAAALHFLLWHCFVPLCSFLCRRAVFVLQCHALCRGSVIGAVVLCFVSWHYILCHSIVLWHCASCHGIFCDTALRNVPQHCVMCCSIVQCATPRHCALCSGIGFCAMASCDVPWHCAMCCRVAWHAVALCSMQKQFLCCSTAIIVISCMHIF